MALTKKEYVELGRLRSALDITNTESDSDLEFAIKAASRFVDGYCNREFWYESAHVEKLRSGDQPFLVLERTPVWSVAEVKHIVNDTTQSLTDLMIEEKAGVLHLQQIVPSRSWHHSGVDQKINYTVEQPNWQVTYAGGYTTPAQDAVSGVDPLPDDLQMATQMIATNIYESRGQDLRIRRMHVLEAAIWYHSGSIEVGVEMILQPYRRI